MTVTTHNEAKLKTFDAFAPFADALEAMLNLEVPGVARDIAKRMTGAGEKLMTASRPLSGEKRKPAVDPGSQGSLWRSLPVAASRA